MYPSNAGLIARPRRPRIRRFLARTAISGTTALARSKHAQSYSLVVKGGTSAAAGGTSAGTTRTSAATARGFLVAAAFQAAALRFLVFAAFVSAAAFSFRVLAAFSPATLNFRLRATFFAAMLRFVGMGIPFSMSGMLTSPL